MESLLGTSIPVYIAVVGVIMGFCAYMTGQSLANNWKPLWLLTFYLILLGFAARFLVYALYQAELLSLSGWICDTIVMLAIGFFGFFVTRSRKMVAQYPWIYERVGLFGWRKRHG